MSRKHFEALAETVRLEMGFLSEADRYRVAVEIARTCRAFNGRFNRDRFFRACGVSEPVVDSRPLEMREVA